MNVTNIREFRSKDTLEALVDLLKREEEAKIQGLAFAIKVGNKRYRWGVTGDFHDDPMEALLCFSRMEHRLHEILSERDSGPDTRTMSV